MSNTSYCIWATHLTTILLCTWVTATCFTTTVFPVYMSDSYPSNCYSPCTWVTATHPTASVREWPVLPVTCRRAPSQNSCLAATACRRWRTDTSSGTSAGGGGGRCSCCRAACARRPGRRAGRAAAPCSRWRRRGRRRSSRMSSYNVIRGGTIHRCIDISRYFVYEQLELQINRHYRDQCEKKKIHDQRD